jgi:hypothetical protein
VARAATQPPLAPGAVAGLEAHRAVDGETAAMLPLRHRAGVISRRQAAAHDNRQQPPAHACLHIRDGVGIESGGGSEHDPAGGGRLEHAVDGHAVEVQVGIEAGAEAVDEGHGAKARRGA